MNRPRHPRAFALKGLAINLSTGMYDVEQEGINYAMPMETTRILKQYYCNNAGGKIKEWYREIDNDTRSTVVRSGGVEILGDDFYPDKEIEG